MTLLDGAQSPQSQTGRPIPASAGVAPYLTRRTFAIISHPDAGKTTLTERLLLASGAIRLAGQVKARGERRRTRSDWMEIEQKRGISVTSSVLTFERDGLTFNLLDTPGHSDFSEDTYRTLTAVDSAIMVIDAAKGIESQTLKLFEVCRLRDIPIITFINKVDREGRDPLSLLDEIAETLALDVTPVTWPLGMGVDFRGCLDLLNGRIAGAHASLGEAGPVDLDQPPPDLLADRIVGPALETLEIARTGLPAFDLEAYRGGHLSPVFFGSALKDVCVRELLDAIAAWAPPPRSQPASPEPVMPGNDQVSGIVFKVQANMDPNHRDRVAFVRLCSGTFRRGMKLHHARIGRDIAISNPILFFAQERETADEAVAGDVIGIPNHGLLSVGDSLSETGEIRFSGIPNFAPEIIRRVLIPDAMKAKQLARALNDLAEEGVTQVFQPLSGSGRLVGVVGPLQLDVLAARLENEYGVSARFEETPYQMARWVSAADPAVLARFIAANRSAMADDRFGSPVFFARSPWLLERSQKDWPDVQFHAVRDLR
ncbi:MAG TPA: peptide chain release factor 3 [Aestuariivirgaceae bacterium]|nr:peptide chain release factor 3 [Aestuariivirgaceae bacterium]